jgi:hypothetical protein
MILIHWSDWSQQPEVRIYCTQTCGHPWAIRTLPPDVHMIPASRTQPEMLYTFARSKVTCLDCLRKLLVEEVLES